jgi:signal transduction histidine kinase
VTRLRGPLGSLAIILGVALAYVTMAKLGLLLAVPPGYATAVWPPSGISLGALLVFGNRCLPGVWFGSFLANLGTSFNGSSAEHALRSLGIAAIIGVGAAAQAWLGAWLVRRFANYPSPLTRERDIFGFFMLGGPVSCLLNPSVGVATLYLAGAIPATATSYSWWTWWVGDTIGALIFAPLTVMWCDDDPEWRERRVTVSIPLAVTFTCAILVFVYASRSETQRLKQHFDQDAGRLANDLAQRLALDVEKLSGVEALFAASTEVEAQEFQNYTEVALVGHPEILALSWVQFVEHERRAEVEDSLRQRGLAPQGIVERANGQHFRRAEQQQYAPVIYVEPRPRFAQTFGFDLLSEPQRRMVLERARDSGKLTAGGPITGLASRAPGDLFFLAQPIYDRGLPAQPSAPQRRAHLLGFALCSFRTPELIDISLREAWGQPPMRLLVEDLDPDGTVQTLYRSSARAEKRLGFDYQRRLPVGDHSWRLTFEPTLAYLADEKTLVAWFVLAGGLIACSLVGAGALVLTGRTTTIAGVVHERTAQLAQTNAKLASEIEQHVQTAQVLDRERRYLQTVLENISEGILVLDPRGTPTLMNEAARRMERLLRAPGADHNAALSYGLCRPDGKTPFDPRELPTTRALHGEVVRDFELVSVGPGRAPRTLMINCQPLRSSGDDARCGAVAVIRDITENRDAERMKSEFVSTVSHELRTPLTSIRGSLRLLAAGVMGALSPEATELVTIASRNGERLAALINDLLDMEKITAGRLDFAMAHRSLLPLLRQSVELNSGFAQAHGVAIRLLETRDDGWVNVDENRFLQVMTNLISNAVKFSPKAREVELSLHARGSKLRVEVRDYGPGIQDEFVPRVFLRFSQADATDRRAKGGTGLGLAISKALMERMHGHIGFQAAPGGGTIFYVELPAVEATAAINA